MAFIAHDMQVTGPLGEALCRTKSLDGRDLVALDYQKMIVVLWGVCKKLQGRIDTLENKGSKGKKAKRSSSRPSVDCRGDLPTQGRRDAVHLVLSLAVLDDVATAAKRTPLRISAL